MDIFSSSIKLQILKRSMKNKKNSIRRKFNCHRKPLDESSAFLFSPKLLFILSLSTTILLQLTNLLLQSELLSVSVLLCRGDDNAESNLLCLCSGVESLEDSFMLMPAARRLGDTGGGLR